MTLIENLKGMGNRDVILYKNLLNVVNNFLTLKDSIRLMTHEEQTVRLELQRCITANQNASRKLSLEGLRTTNYTPQPECKEIFANVPVFVKQLYGMQEQ